MLAHRYQALAIVSAVCLTFLLVIGATSRTAAQDAATAGQLLQTGIEQLEAGELEQARATLRRVDPVRLSREERATLSQALATIREEEAIAREPAPEPEAEAPEPEPLPEPEPAPEPAPQPEPEPAPVEPVEEEAPVDEVDPRIDEDDNAQRLLEQARLLEAQQLVAQAEQAMDAGQHNRAVQLYTRALQLDPENEEAQRGLEAARAAAAVDDPGVLEEFAEIRELRAEQARARYEEAMTRAQRHLEAGEHRRATEAVALATAILDTNRQFLTEAEYNQLRDEATLVGDEIQRAMDAERERILRDTQDQVLIEQQRIRLERERQQQERIQGLLRRAADLRRDLAYEESLEILEQVLFLEPTNVAAQAMKEMIQDTMIVRNHRVLTRERSLELSRHSVELLEASVPYTQLIQYPPDWPQLTRMRTGVGPGMGAGGAADQVVMDTLREPIRVAFENHRFDNAVDYFRRLTDVNFHVNWRALEVAGVDANSTVNLELEDVPAERALRLVLDQVGDGFTPLSYAVDDGIVNISTQEDLGRNTTVHTYDIRDLLVQAPHFSQAPSFDLVEITRGDRSNGSGGPARSGSRSSGSGSGNGSGGLFAGDHRDQEDVEAREELTMQIMDLIRETIDPDNWREMGGMVSSMQELNGQLIVNTTGANHGEITGLLRQLRETRAIQINVEARFLLVDQNFLDEVGVDMDITIDNLGADWAPIVIQQDSIGIAERQSTAITGSFGSPEGTIVDDPAAADPSFRRGMTVTGGFMNDIQVDMLIRATQANRRTTNLSAPRLTFFNGQRAFVMVATQLSYVSDLEAVVGTGAIGFDPQIDVVSSGVILDVEGTVSADRRYVTLTARPSLARVIRVRAVQAAQAVAGGAGFGFVGQIGDDDDDVAPQQTGVASGIIEAPELELTVVNTTVSVPDKGTLLLGGQRLLADIEIEAGVPVLSKLPIINRLFTNRSTVKDERTLLILMRPTIIIQQEKEDELFPGMQGGGDFFGPGAGIGL